MDLAVLFSGGKDSTMALYKILQEGHDVKYLVSAFPKNPESYLFHVSNIHLTELAAEAIGIQLKRVEIEGVEDTQEADELEEAVKGLGVDGLVAGGVSSNYQGRVFGGVAKNLGIELVTPYWGVPHDELIKEAIGAGFEIIFTSVSAEGLTEDWLGRRLDNKALEDLKKLNEKFGVDVGGEGGEYCTVVTDGPIFKKRISIIESRKEWSGMAGRLVVEKAELVGNAD